VASANQMCCLQLMVFKLCGSLLICTNFVLCGLLSLKIIVRVCIHRHARLLASAVYSENKFVGQKEILGMAHGNISSELVHGILFCNRSGNIQV